MEPRKILLALDKSEPSEAAFRWYLESVYLSGDSIILLHVVDVPYYSEGSSAFKDLISSG